MTPESTWQKKLPLIMPAEVFEKVKNEIPGNIGVYTSSLKEHNGLLGLTLTRKARRRGRERSCSEMIFMMFRSYEREILSMTVKNS